MKFIKNSLVSIIAILAISTTLAAHEDIFEDKRAQIANCFIPSQTLVYKDINCTDEFSFQFNTSCSNTEVINSPWGHIFSGLSNNNKISDASVPIVCAGNENVCCVFVEIDPDPCKGQGAFSLNSLPFNTYRIVSVECKM